MILYTSKVALLRDVSRPNYQFVSDADSYFNQLVEQGTITEKDCTFIQKILLSEKSQTENKEDILTLSTSAKTLILAKKFPEIILSNANITKEASLYLLVLFGESERAFVYVLPTYYEPQNGGIGGSQYEDLHQNIISDDTTLKVIVISEHGRTECTTYKDAIKAVAYWTGKMIWDMTENYRWDGKFILDENADLEESGHFLRKLEFDPLSFDWSYSLLYHRNYEILFRRESFVPNPGCAIAGCALRVDRYEDCFVLGGQFIVSNSYANDMSSGITIHAPFGNEPVQEQLDAIERFAQKSGFLAPYSGKALSEGISNVLLDNINEDFKKNHVIHFIIDENGEPQIIDVYHCSADEGYHEDINYGKEHLIKNYEYIMAHPGIYDDEEEEENFDLVGYDYNDYEEEGEPEKTGTKRLFRVESMTSFMEQLEKAGFIVEEIDEEETGDELP